MIEEIVNGIWEDIFGTSKHENEYTDDEIKCRWRIIIRKAISDNQQSSQAMLEETAVMERRY